MITEMDQATAAWCKAASRLHKEQKTGGPLLKDAQRRFDEACEARKRARENPPKLDWAV